LQGWLRQHSGQGSRRSDHNAQVGLPLFRKLQAVDPLREGTPRSIRPSDLINPRLESGFP